MSAHDDWFCANCDDYLPDTIAARVRLLERWEIFSPGHVLNVCDWCGKALIEDGVAEAVSE